MALTKTLTNRAGQIASRENGTGGERVQDDFLFLPGFSEIIGQFRHYSSRLISELTVLVWVEMG